MFDSLLNSIYEKIGKIKSPIKRKQGLKKLEESILKNATYKHQYTNICIYNEAKDKNAAIKLINERNDKFLETKCCCTIGKENAKLAEFFNIDLKSVKKTKLDEATKFKSHHKKPKDVIKESFRQIHKTKDSASFHKQLQIAQFLAEGIKNLEDKKFITASLLKLRQLKEANFASAVEKAYKLRVLVEKQLREFSKDDESFPNQQTPGKEVGLTDLTYFKKIKVEVPYNYTSPEKIVIYAVIPFYPSGIYQLEIANEIRKIKKKMDRLERIFINKTIYQAGRDKYFNPVGTIWDSTMDDAPANVSTRMKRNKGVAGVVPYRLAIYINTAMNEGIDWKTYYTEVHKMLKDFETVMQEQFPTELDASFQKQELVKRKAELIKSKRKKHEKRKENDETSKLSDRYHGYFE